MIINLDRAITAFKKVQHVQEEYSQYTLSGKTNVLSIEDLYRVVGNMYQLRITKTQVPFEGNFLRGLMERYEASIKIRIRMNQTDDWKRFTAVKELCHVIIDEKEDWSTDGVTTIKDLLMEYFLGDGEEAKRASQSEMMAEMAAVELLYPYECRASDLRDKVSFVKIASYHGLPQAMVSRVLDSHYHNNVAQPIWAALARLAA